MLQWKLHFVLLLPALFVVIWPGDGVVQETESSTTSLNLEVEVLEPCAEIQVTSVEVICKTKFGFIARLDFPQLDLDSVLEGEEYLPQAEAVFTEKEKSIGSKTYRNIAFRLQWKSVTPEFLQIYIHEYLPYWGNQVPYRLFWTVSYEQCLPQNCGEWLSVNETGEILPSDVPGLHPDLAADSNFNGVPAAFWNVNVIP